MARFRAKQYARFHGGLVIQSAMDGGWPFNDGEAHGLTDEDGELTERGEQVEHSLRELVEQLTRYGSSIEQ